MEWIVNGAVNSIWKPILYHKKIACNIKWVDEVGDLFENRVRMFDILQ